MTEAEWLACTDPLPMLEFLRGQASARKLRLFAAACCRRVWHLVPDPRWRDAVEAAERYADGLTDGANLVLARWEALMAFRGEQMPLWLGVLQAASGNVEGMAETVARKAALAAEQPALTRSGKRGARAVKAVTAEWKAQCALLRDLFGNPFRPVTVNPSWLTPKAVELAQSIYDERAFQRLPELAREFTDAGCIDQDILTHCRSRGQHGRGCWLVDAVLGKS